MKKKLIISILLFNIILILPINTPAITIADLRRELDEIEQREKENNNNIYLTETEIKTTQNEVGNIYAEIEEITKTIKESEEEIESLNKEIEQKDANTKNLMASLQKTEGNSFYIEYLFGAETIEDFIYRYAITEQITKYNSELITQMKQMIKKNEEKKVELSNKRVELEKRQSKLSFVNKQLQDL